MFVFVIVLFILDACSNLRTMDKLKLTLGDIEGVERSTNH